MSFISLIERKVLALGASWREFDSMDYSLVEFRDSLDMLDKLKLVDAGNMVDAPMLFYPGCGCDIIFPLEYVKRLWPTVRVISCVFVDEVNQVGLIETVLDTLGISFARESNVLVFYWADILVRLRVVRADVFSFVKTFSGYDIYFERAFRIMKDGCADYERKVVEGLNSDGVIISDSGFVEFDSWLYYVPVVPELSIYGEMVFGRKKSNRSDTIIQ